MSELFIDDDQRDSTEGCDDGDPVLEARAFSQTGVFDLAELDELFHHRRVLGGIGGDCQHLPTDFRDLLLDERGIFRLALEDGHGVSFQEIDVTIGLVILACLVATLFVDRGELRNDLVLGLFGLRDNSSLSLGDGLDLLQFLTLSDEDGEKRRKRRQRQGHAGQ